MATKTAPKKTPSKDTLTELELLALETNKASVELLTKQVAEARKRVAGMEQDVILRLRAGAKVQGGLTAMLQLQGGGTISPSWKGHYLKHMLEAHNVSAETAEQDLRRITTPSAPTEVLVIGRKAG